MAEPLTTSDIFRIRSGWGTGGDTAERQRWAAAGLSPATTAEREDVRLGRGISPLASPESKAATIVEEIRTGLRPASDLPEEYGGRPQITVGPRFDEKGQPIGTFRRQLRMQEMWDARQKEALDQQRIAQQLDLQQRTESRLQRDQDFELEKARMLEDREARVQKEAGLMVDSIRGAIGPDGRVISRPIRPEDDNAIERLDNLARDFKLGIENKAAASMFSTLYNDALKYREDKMKQSQEQELAAVNLSVQTGKPFKELGAYTEQGLFKPNVPAMIGAAEQVKTAEEKKAEEKAIATETRRATAELTQENRKAAIGITDKIYELGSKIRENDSLLEIAKTQKERDEYTRKGNLLREEDAILRKRLNELVPQQPEITKFNTTQEAEAANLPKGTIVEIGGRKARID